MRRLTLFWLVCALAGFAAVSGVALLLCMTLDRPGPGVSPNAPLAEASPAPR